ncbi:MAG: MutS-related protein, partial [Aggregatilineales bacterium]
MKKNTYIIPADFSLLWQASTPPRNTQTDSYLRTDMNLSFLVRALALQTTYEKTVRSVLLALDTDPVAIGYRQAIFEDVWRNDALASALLTILEDIETLESYLHSPQWKENPLQQLAWRLSELERFVKIVERLYKTLTGAGGKLQSEGLIALRGHIINIHDSPILQELREELPLLLPRVQNIRSITIGMNLNAEMKPISVTLLDIHTAEFTGAVFMSKFFRRQRVDSEMAGLGELHPMNPSYLHHNNMLSRLPRGDNAPRFLQLMLDLAQVSKDISLPIIKALRKYTEIQSRFLLALKDDLAFYLGAVQLMKKIKAAGMSLTQPELLSSDAREMHLDGLYNINLCVQRLGQNNDAGHIVGNDAHFDDGGRLFILTGPNQGGKTTYTQAIGLAQILAQAGLPVPADSARLSPVDSIYTHFATEENASLEAGRLGEEARRLHEIFQSITRHSLVLLNESLASTSASESLLLARDVVRALRLSGVRGIFATHLHELASDAESMNADSPGDSKIISVVSQVVIDEGDAANPQVRRTY